MTRVRVSATIARSASGAAAPVSTRRRAQPSSGSVASIASISSSVRYVVSTSLPACAHRRTVSRCRNTGERVSRQCAIAARQTSQISSYSPAARKYSSCVRFEKLSAIQPLGVSTEMPMPLSSHRNTIGSGPPRFLM